MNGDTSPVAAATASFVSSRLRHTLINRLYTDEACSTFTFTSLATATGDGQLIVVPTTPCKSTKTISFEQKMYIKATKVDHTWLRSAQTV